MRTSRFAAFFSIVSGVISTADRKDPEKRVPYAKIWEAQRRIVINDHEKRNVKFTKIET
jgi:hypothetical protein